MQHQKTIDKRKPLTKLSGLIVALLTPFTEKNGISPSMLKKHLRFLSSSGVKSILVNGTTGEFYAMTQNEQLRLLKLVRSIFSGTILYHIHTNCVKEGINKIQSAQDVGADAIVTLPPSYPAGLPKEGVIEFLNQMQKSTRIPFILYNYTANTKNPITPDILSSVKHFAIKDSSKDFSLIPCSSRYFVGSDKTIVSPTKKGAVGFVSAFANCIPALYVSLETCLKQKNYKKAQQIEKEIATQTKAYTGPHKIAYLKHRVSQSISGYPQTVRVPLCQQITDFR